jgi:hypothetical protein
MGMAAAWWDCSMHHSIPHNPIFRFTHISHVNNYDQSFYYIIIVPASIQVKL